MYRHSPDEDPDLDWVWSGKLYDTNTALEADGNLIQVLNPKLVHPSDASNNLRVTYRFKSDELQGVALMHYETAIRDLQALPQVTRSAVFPSTLSGGELIHFY